VVPVAVPEYRRVAGGIGEVAVSGRAVGYAQRLSEERAEKYPETTVSRRCRTAAPYPAVRGKLAARRGAREETLSMSEGPRALRYPRRETLSHTMERARLATLLWNGDEALSLIQAFDQGTLHRWRWTRPIGFESLRDHRPFEQLLRPKGSGTDRRVFGHPTVLRSRYARRSATAVPPATAEPSP
jgi:hypothetical protein